MANIGPWIGKGVVARHLLNAGLSRYRRRTGLASAAILVAAFLTASARAEHAVIDLRVIGPDGQAQAVSDQEPPVGGVNPRPKLAVRARDPLVLQFILTNAYPHGTLRDVTIRYCVAAVHSTESTATPDLKADAAVITRGEFTLNFKPKCRVGARMQLRIDEPGAYVVRVDTLNTKSDHEHFAAIDLEVK